MECQDIKTDIFATQSTCMEVSVSLLCLCVHEPPYQTTVVCCNAIFRCDSSRMDHHAVFHMGVGLAQARPNYVTLNRTWANISSSSLAALHLYLETHYI